MWEMLHSGGRAVNGAQDTPQAALVPLQGLSVPLRGARSGLQPGDVLPPLEGGPSPEPAAPGGQDARGVDLRSTASLSGLSSRKSRRRHVEVQGLVSSQAGSTTSWRSINHPVPLLRRGFQEVEGRKRSRAQNEHLPPLLLACLPSPLKTSHPSKV